MPPRAISVPLAFPLQGIRYDDLSEEEKKRWEATDWGDGSKRMRPPNSVQAEAVNKWLFNTDTVDKALEVLMIQGHRVAGGDRLGKTIIFAKNNATPTSSPNVSTPIIPSSRALRSGHHPSRSPTAGS